MKRLFLFFIASYLALLVEAIGGYISIQPTKRQSRYIGETYSLESNNYPQHRIGIRDDNTAGIVLYGVEEFRIIEALNGQFDAVSLQSISDKNKYLRHQNFILKLHPNDLSELFKNDASFKIRDDKYYPGYVSLESTNYPGYYLRHQDFIVKLHPEEPMVELYKRDASFKLVQLGFARIGKQYSFESQNYPQYRIGINDDDTAGILENNLDGFRIVKALNGRADCVSLQSMKDSNKYLRHQNFVLKLHPVDLTSELFKNDASFIMRDNNYYPGYVSFESTNYPGFFLRHQNFIVKLNKEEPFVELFTKDASFKLVEKVPKIGAIYSFESNNYPQHRIGVKDDNTAGIFLYGIEEFRIVKANVFQWL